MQCPQHNKKQILGAKMAWLRGGGSTGHAAIYVHTVNHGKNIARVCVWLKLHSWPYKDLGWNGLGKWVHCEQNCCHDHYFRHFKKPLFKVSCIHILLQELVLVYSTVFIYWVQLLQYSTVWRRG